MEKSKGNKSNEIVPEIAHLIENNKGSSTTTEMDTASVTVTTFDNLSDLAAPWRKEETADNEEEEDSSEEESEEEEEVPGMSMKPAAVEKVIIGSKEKKAINKAAGRELQKSKGFKTKERMRVKKQRNESKFKKRESEAYMLASDRVSTVSRNLSSLSDLDLDKHIGDMMGEAPEDQDTPENVSETQSSSGSKRLRRKISKEGKSKRRSTKL